MGRLEETIGGLKYDEKGLIPAVVVDVETRQVLMLAYMNKASLLATIRTGRAHFWSRSRRKQWMKGQTSGHVQRVRAIYTDCDKDALVIEAFQQGGACHEGYFSCFFRRLDDGGRWEVIAEKVFDPEAAYKDQSGD